MLMTLTGAASGASPSLRDGDFPASVSASIIQDISLSAQSRLLAKMETASTRTSLRDLWPSARTYRETSLSSEEILQIVVGCHVSTTMSDLLAIDCISSKSQGVQTTMDPDKSTASELERGMRSSRTAWISGNSPGWKM